MEKQLKDYIHFYLGCEVIGNYLDEPRKGYLTGVRNGGYEAEIQFFEEDGFNVKEEPEFTEIKEIKLLLRPLSDITEEDFYSFFEAGNDPLIKATVNGYWAAGWYDKDEYEEMVKEGSSINHRDLIIYLEEASYDNVWSCGKGGDLAYGTGDEMRYFTDLKTQAVWIAHLAKRGLDIFGLIPSGLAIDKTTINQ